MSKIRTREWDPAEHLETEEDMAAYLNAALEEGRPKPDNGNAGRHRPGAANGSGG